MTVSFEPGDGSFEIILDAYEAFPQEWNIPSAFVMRRVSSCQYVTLKCLGQTLLFDEEYQSVEDFEEEYRKATEPLDLPK